MSDRPSLTTGSLVAVLGYGQGVHGLALGYTAAIPKGEERLAILKALLDAAQAADAKRSEATHALRVAINERDALFDSGFAV